MITTREKTFGTEWGCINPDGSWEYQSDIEDDETYISGNYILDDDEETVIDYDGCYELPVIVEELLKIEGYTLDL